MEKKIKFQMILSNDEDTEFEVMADLTEGKIVFYDINNIKNVIEIENKTVRITRDIGEQFFVEGKKTSAKYEYKEGLTLNIDVFTETIKYENNRLEVRFENYVNGEFTNKHKMIIEVIN